MRMSIWRLNGTDGLNGDAHNYDYRGAAERYAGQDRCIGEAAYQDGHNGDDARGRGHRCRVILLSTFRIYSLVGLPARKPGMKPPFFLRLLAISTGSNWMVA